MDVTEVDGSFGEGGGQIIRIAVTLATILKKRIRVLKIRANRPNPGLASQHLQSLLALLDLSGGRSSPLAKGSVTFDLDPMAGRDHPSTDMLERTIDLKTAGSVTLCIQCILPYLLTLSCPSRVTIIGGTHVLKAPNTDYMERVFNPAMRSMGYDFDLEVIRPGYFPRGGGQVVLSVRPGHKDKFHHFELNNRGHLLSSKGILNLTPPLLKDHKGQLVSQVRSIEVSDIETRKVSYASVEYFLRYEHNTFGFYRLQEGRPPKPTPAQVLTGIEEVEAEVKSTLTSDPSLSVDSFLQDQLVIYMTLAKLMDPAKTSSYTTYWPLTDHTLSAIHVCQLLTGLEFKVTEVKGHLAQVTL